MAAVHFVGSLSPCYLDENLLIKNRFFVPQFFITSLKVQKVSSRYIRIKIIHSPLVGGQEGGTYATPTNFLKFEKMFLGELERKRENPIGFCRIPTDFCEEL